jgi:hypothetical protein
MFLEEYKKQTRHVRKSKTGMDPKRLSNNYFHVCSNCDAKVFAQKKGVERKRVWNLYASSDIPISKL